MSVDEQFDVFKVTAGILHLGNVDFVEEGNYASIECEDCKSQEVVLFCFFFRF